MEVKVWQRNRAHRFSLLPHSTPPSLILSLSNWANTKKSFNNQLRGIALRWRFQLLADISKHQLSTKHHFVHILEGYGRNESLTSTSNQNGDPPHSIVMANKKIMDTDLEQKRQNIKIQNPREIRNAFQLEEKLQSALNGLRIYKKLFALASSHQPPARTTSFIVLVPLVIFCARCIIGASYARAFGTLKLKAIDKQEGERRKFRSGHWRSALRDIRELDGLDCEAPIDSTSPSEDEQISVEELSHAYKKLDQDYEKFLSECGLSKWGYWRGGTQRPEQE
ncbi:uncharacterized protein LOC101208955 isoform X3 [Cucumis sativus]|uniref:uncharacterized protein LOC101208955 isoform X3 n=1 Tax=Cucumis sativus TaxID=3659 RepID=UPI0005EC8966|nr:uncharacterized protein LOC101208955 isoform X3 [Cucumis sativus]